MNREAWLTAVVRALRPHYRRAGLVVPQGTRISVGWPSTRGESKRIDNRAVGECWDASATQDGNPQIFVSPVEFDAVEVAGIVAHEMIHAAGVEGVHGRAFQQAMKSVGLIGRPSAARPGKQLQSKIVEIVDRIGPYPHSAIRI